MRGPKFTMIALLISAMLSGSCTSDKLQVITQNMDRLLKDPTDHEALEVIKGETTSSNSGNRTNAAAALALVGQIHKKLGPEMLDVLIKGLSDREQSVRRESALALRNVAQPATARAIPALTKSLREGDDDVAWFSAEALGNYGPLAKGSVPALVEALEAFYKKSEFNLISEKTADALGDIGDSNAKPILIKASQSMNDRTREAAGKALSKLSSDNQ